VGKGERQRVEKGIVGGEGGKGIVSPKKKGVKCCSFVYIGVNGRGGVKLKFAMSGGWQNQGRAGGGFKKWGREQGG